MSFNFLSSFFPFNSYEFFLAVRYLRSTRKTRAARVTSLAAGFGIACGVAALIIATSLANGFRSELQDKILRGTAHISLARADNQGIENWRAWQSKIGKIKGVRRVLPTTYTGALLVSSANSNYAVVRAIDLSESEARAELENALIAGNVDDLTFNQTAGEDDDNNNAPPIIPVVIGVELAAHANLNLGDEAKLVTNAQPETSINRAHHKRASSSSSSISSSASSRDSLTSNAANKVANDPASNLAASSSSDALASLSRASVERIRVVGIFRSDLHDYDAAWIYASLPDAANFAGNSASAPTVLSIELNDLNDAARLAEAIKSAMQEAAAVSDNSDLQNSSGFQVVTWQESNAALFAALELERRTISAVILLITLIATLNILTTLVLLVVERRAAIALLRALGAKTRSIAAIFIIEGFFIGLIGVACGVSLGLAACWIGNRFKLVSLPAEVYAISYVPLRPRALDVGLAVVAALLICLLATIYPAHVAARVHPAEALRAQ